MSLTWTKELPTKPGYYWYRYDKNSQHYIYWIHKYEQNLWVYDGSEPDCLLTSVMYDKSEWAGPIEEPK